MLRGYDFPGTQVRPSAEHGYQEFLEQKAADAHLCTEAKNLQVTYDTSGCSCPCPLKFTSPVESYNQKPLYI